MKFFLLNAFLLFVNTGAFAQKAPEFVFENQQSIRFTISQNELIEFTNKVYDFVTQYSSDAFSHEKIKIVFKSLPKHHGFFNKQNPRVLAISDKLRSHVEYQLTLAHELVHLLRYQHNTNEDYWLDEALAKYIEIEYANDWPTKYQKQIENNAIYSLPVNPDLFQIGTSGYANVYFLIHYLQNRLGGFGFINGLLRSTHSGWDSIEHVGKELRQKSQIAIPSQYINRRTLFIHFAHAMCRNDMFTAAYSLFYIDPRFKRLHSSSLSSSLSLEDLPDASFVCLTQQPSLTHEPNRTDMVVHELPDNEFVFIKPPKSVLNSSLEQNSNL